MVMSHPPKNSPPMYNCGNVGQLLYVFIPTLNCSLAKMSTSVNGTFMLCKICTHVFENPHFGADFVPFMNRTTLFSVTHLSICVFSSGPRFARILLLNVVDDFLEVVELKEEEIDVLAPLEERIEGEDRQEVKVVVAIIISAAFRLCVCVCVCVYMCVRVCVLYLEKNNTFGETEMFEENSERRATKTANKGGQNNSKCCQNFFFPFRCHVSLWRQSYLDVCATLRETTERARARFIYIL